MGWNNCQALLQLECGMNSQFHTATTAEIYKNLISASPDCKYFNDSSTSRSVLPKTHSFHLGNAHLLLPTAKHTKHRILIWSSFINPSRIILLYLIREKMLQESHKYVQTTEITENLMVCVPQRERGELLIPCPCRGARAH